VNLAILGFVYCLALGKSKGFIARQSNNLLQHYNTCKVINSNFYCFDLFFGLRCLYLNVSLFFVFRFQVSMVEKKCYFVENVGGVHEDTLSTTPT
jgi:hypothetical protein